MMRRLGSMIAVLVAQAVAMTAEAAPAARFDDITYVAEEAFAASPGTFRNPVLPGFQPDPSIVRVGEDFYLANSTFGWFRNSDLPQPRPGPLEPRRPCD